MPPDVLAVRRWVLALLGLCIGSFLNVVIHRLPLMLERGWRQESAELLGVPVPESRARSRCRRRARAARRAATRIRWYENIPLAQLAVAARPLLGLQDARSRRAIRWSSCATGALFAAIGWRFGAAAGALLWCGFAAVLVALAADRLGHHSCCPTT